jgi:hypothetical protein
MINTPGPHRALPRLRPTYGVHTHQLSIVSDYYLLFIKVMAWNSKVVFQVQIIVSESDFTASTIGAVGFIWFNLGPF